MMEIIYSPSRTKILKHRNVRLTQRVQIVKENVRPRAQGGLAETLIQMIICCKNDPKIGPNFGCASFLKLPFKLNENLDTTTLLYSKYIEKHDDDQPIFLCTLEQWWEYRMKLYLVNLFSTCINDRHFFSIFSGQRIFLIMVSPLA